MVELSKRLRALADMVTPGNRVADVGCDHGFVSVYLVQRGISPRVYAMDINRGPLLRAGEHIARCGLGAYIETRLSDGVQALAPGEAQTLLCAGMGGRLMQKILTEGGSTVGGMRELILQPQSEIARFRAFLREAGYRVTREDMIYEEGKYYPMMKAEHCGAAEAGAVIRDRRIADKFGGLLIRDAHPVLIRYLKERIETYENIRRRLQGGGTAGGEEARSKRLKAVTEEIEDMRLALSEMENNKGQENTAW